MYTTTATNGANNTVTLRTLTTPRTNSNQRLVDEFLVWLLSIENKLVCLRDKKTKQILNVSYTESGLMHTYANKNGACLYFNPETTWYSTNTNNYFNPSFKGKRDKNPQVFVEIYKPYNHIDKNGVTLSRLQSAEIYFIGKAQKLVLPINADSSDKSYAQLKADYELYCQSQI